MFDFLVALYFTPHRFNALRSRKVSQTTFKELRMRRALVKLWGLLKPVTKMVTGCCKSDKSCYICSLGLKTVLVKYEKCGTPSILEIPSCLEQNSVFIANFSIIPQ